MRTLSAIRATVRQVLRDEFVSSDEDYTWEDDELDLIISSFLVEISRPRPYQVKETVYAVNKSGTATSTLANHLVDTSASFVAGDVGKTVYNTTDKSTAIITVRNSASDVTLDTDIMTSGEDYEIYCAGGTNPRDIYIGDITGLLSVDEVEYPTRRRPKNLRNFDIFGDVLTIDVGSAPDDGDEVFVYCYKVHTLTESSSTLDIELEELLIQGVTAQAAINKVQSMIDKINIGGANADSRMQNWGITQLTLYRNKLNQITSPRVNKRYT
jgi:hypothetical protein